MKKFKMIAMTVAMMLCMTAMTACGGDKNDGGETAETTTTTLPIDATMTDLGGAEDPTNTTTTTTVSPTEETTETTDTTEDFGEGTNGGSDNAANGGQAGNSSYSGVDYESIIKDDAGNYSIELMKLVPDGEITHPDANFGIITIEENEIDMFTLTNAEFVETTLTTHEGSVKHTHNTSDFYFKGHSFCRGLHNPMIFLEYLTAENTLLYVKSDPIYKEKFNGDVYLKGFSQTVDDANDNYEYVTYYGGVRLNMRREEIEAILGEGMLGTDTENTTVIYKSNTTTMVIVYKMTDEYITGETEVADAIFVIKNN